VPDLVGLAVAEARAAWTAAGFTGAFNPAFGLNNKLVETQDQALGACLPATTTVTVTFS
jgi:hypothetical protein